MLFERESSSPRIYRTLEQVVAAVPSDEAEGIGEVETLAEAANASFQEDRYSKWMVAADA